MSGPSTSPATNSSPCTRGGGGALSGWWGQPGGARCTWQATTKGAATFTRAHTLAYTMVDAGSWQMRAVSWAGVHAHTHQAAVAHHEGGHARLAQQQRESRQGRPLPCCMSRVGCGFGAQPPGARSAFIRPPSSTQRPKSSACQVQKGERTLCKDALLDAQLAQRAALGAAVGDGHPGVDVLRRGVQVLESDMASVAPTAEQD